MATQQDITNFVNRHFGMPLPPHRWPTLDQIGAPARPPTSSAEECAQALVQDEEFRALQLGTWLNTPNGEVISAAVQAALPPPYNAEVRVITDGLRLAAEMQRRQGWKTAGGIFGVGAVVMILTILARSGS